MGAPIPDQDAESIAAHVFQKVPGVNRCVVDLTGHGVKHTRLLAATVTRRRLDLLREADAIVMDGLRRHGLYREVWQCPTVFVPLEIDGHGSEFVVIRPVLSERAMTARPALLPQTVLSDLRDRILQLPDVSGVAVDITTNRREPLNGSDTVDPLSRRTFLKHTLLLSAAGIAAPGTEAARLRSACMLP